MAIKTKQVEVFMVGDKEFKTIEEAKAYEKFLQKDFISDEEFAQAIEEKLVEVNFDQYKELPFHDLMNEARKFEKEYFSDITYKGINPYDMVQNYVFDKYVLESIRANYYEFDNLPDANVMKLYYIAYFNNRGNYTQVENNLQDIADIVKIINVEE
jgi:hypothetical protein